MSSWKETLGLYRDKASSSLRFLIIEKETRQARHSEALYAELKGDRIWKISGVGVLSYDLDSAEERTKMSIWKEWSSQSSQYHWLEAARARTAFYNTSG